MVDYDPTTALIVVDVQNDFADSEGSLAVPGAEAIVPRINEEIERATAAGAHVIYSQDWHPERTPHFASDGGTWPAHCVADTWGAQFHAALTVLDGSEVIRKGTGGEDGYSVFSVRDPRSGATHATELESVLRERNIERIVLAGLATDYCVKETALDALRLGFGVHVVGDAIGAVDLEEGDGERALQEVAAAGGQVA